ncbi:unnamed protein product [Didymodactylos carnosus]|uniref:Uncharacterized protein n=1 Tax=Didymodactylos carnosus TaxID=1234261 RepID=A0A814TTI1_9BILA|nr:unnamed protein product [Didymodactylos carnosus]CAF3929709.1 unnamed protein product [Didymodactylos carnosus]
MANVWNTFQHEHAGQGLSQTEMSTMYHDDSSATTVDIGGGMSGAEADISGISNGMAEATLSDTAEVSTPSTNPWNTFQHEHADEGLSKSELCDIYQQQKSAQPDNAQPPSSEPVSTETASSETSTTQSAVQSGEEPTLSNKWNEFEHEHVDEGLSQSEMSELYQKQNSTKQDVSHTTSAGNSTTQDPSQSAEKLSPENEWNKFEKDHAGEGLSKSEMSDMYQQEKSTLQDESQLPEQNNNTDKAAESENHQWGIDWQAYEHLFQGRGFTPTQLSEMYRSFRWPEGYQLELTPDGTLVDPMSASSKEAMKTGLFDENNRLRNNGEVKYSVFRSVLKQMNIADSGLVSSMYDNVTGTSHLQAKHLKTRCYRDGVTESGGRDADHILEPQNLVPFLNRTALSHKDFHKLRQILNDSDYQNVESRGVVYNRDTKNKANRGIQSNRPELNQETFKQEQIQRDKARQYADQCREQNYPDVAKVFDQLGDKCDRLNNIHSMMNDVTTISRSGKSTVESENNLVSNIQEYEKLFGTLEFNGGNVTRKHNDIFARAHSAQQDVNP